MTAALPRGAQVSTVKPTARDAPHFACLDKWEGGVCTRGELWCMPLKSLRVLRISPPAADAAACGGGNGGIVATRTQSGAQHD